MARAKQPRDAVQFTRESAERIANVVRAAETAAPDASPLSFAKRFYERHPRQVRAATFSGAWAIGSSKVVTFKNAPTATASVQNLSWPITLTAYSNEDCIVGKDGTAWYLVVPRLEAKTAVFASNTFTSTYVVGKSTAWVIADVIVHTATIHCISDVSVTASLDTSNCSISVGVTKSENETTVVGSIDVARVRVPLASGTATAVLISSAYTSTFLRVRMP